MCLLIPRKLIDELAQVEERFAFFQEGATKGAGGHGSAVETAMVLESKSLGQRPTLTSPFEPLVLEYYPIALARLAVWCEDSRKALSVFHIPSFGMPY